MRNWRIACAAWALGCVVFAGCGPAGRGSAKPSAAEAGEPVTFAIGGMHCDGCAGAIAKAIEDLPGVRSAKVSFQDKQAVIVPAKDQFDPATVVAAVRDLGYEASPAALPQAKRQ